MSRRVAVLIPCRDEAVTIARVVADFRAALPQAEIHVYDNGSRDGSAALAAAAGAQVRPVSRPGKAEVMRRLFADVEADAYLMVDGDDTYDAAAAPRLLAALFEDGADMVVALREAGQGAYRPGHGLGNRMFSGVLSWLFGQRCGDVLSGYRALSRRCVKSFPVLSRGFGIEAELTVHALELGMPVAELATAYRARPEGSHSKLGTWTGGLRVLTTLLRLFVAERPLLVYGGLAAGFVLASLGLGLPLVETWLETGLVPRFPTAILATGLALMGALALTAGLVLDTVTRGRRELKRLAYLAVPGPR